MLESGVPLAATNHSTDGPNGATSAHLQDDLIEWLCRWPVEHQPGLGVECALVAGTRQAAPVAVEID